MAKSFNDALASVFESPTIVVPVSVLDSLAASLNQKAPYSLRFRVSRTTADGRAIHSLRVELNTLDYTLEIITISHLVTQPYPVRIYGLLLAGAKEASTEEELFDILALAINSDKAREMIAALVAQAKA